MMNAGTRGLDKNYLKTTGRRKIQKSPKGFLKYGSNDVILHLIDPLYLSIIYIINFDHVLTWVREPSCGGSQHRERTRTGY